MDPEKLQNLASMALVGALWGCTNPLLRKGAVETEAASSATYNNNGKTSFLRSMLRLFLNAKVWLPYLLNQSGSIVFYILLANSDLSLAVPVCNALALVFSLITGIFVGEPIQKPVQTFIGASLVLLGTTMCVSSEEA